jgi:hypothetical protein
MVMDKKSLLVRRMARGEFDLTRAAEARQLPSMGCQATRQRGRMLQALLDIKVQILFLRTHWNPHVHQRGRGSV